MKKRPRVNRKTVYAATALLLCAGAGLLLAHTGHGVPCVFRVVTGWRCPGCGITTLFLSLLKGDIRTAYFANPFLFCTLPVLGAMIVIFRIAPVHGKIKTLFQKILPAAYLVALILFGVFRNVSA